MRIRNIKMDQTQSISISDKLKEVGRHSIIYGIGSVAQSASSLILLPILTGNLTKADFGAYSLILMLSSIASAIFYLGITSALPRSYFDYTSINDKRAVFTTGLVVLLLGAVLQSAIGYFFKEEISRLLFGEIKHDSAIFYSLCSGATSFINYYLQSYFRLERKSIESVIFSVGSLVGVVGLNLYFIYKYSDKVVATFEAMMYAQIAIAMIFLAVYGKAALSKKIIPKEIAKLLRLGYPIIIASFGGLLIDAIDRIMIEKIMGLASVGDFSAAVRVSMIVNIVFVMPFVQVWQPMMMEYRLKENIKEFFSSVFSIYIMIGGVLLIGISLFSINYLPKIIRSEITPEIQLVFLTGAASFIILSATNFMNAGLYYERKMPLINIAYYGVALAKVMINMLFIPIFGLMGASLSLFLCSLALPVAVYMVSKKYFEFELEWNRVLRMVAVVLPSLFIGYYSSFNESIGVVFRFGWFLGSVLMVYKLVLTFKERSHIKRSLGSFLKKKGV